MRVDRCEVELAGDQEDDGPDGVEAGEAAGSTLGGLEQAIERFEEAIGLAGLRPGHDALELATHHGGDLFHRLDLGAHDAGAPALEHVTHDVDLLALEDLAQLLLVDPGPCGANGGHPGDEGVQIGGGLGAQAGGPSAATSACP